MPRRSLEQVVAAAHGALVEGERTVEYGTCWGAQLRHRVPLFLTARRQYLMVLTDRRLLLFQRRRGHALRPSDLVIGKRYASFQLERVHRGRPLFQVIVVGTNGIRMVFEFRPRRRRVGEALAHRLDPSQPAPPPAPTPATVGGPDITGDDGPLGFWEPPTRGP